MTSYRVREYQKKFYVQGMFERKYTTGMLWWKKEHTAYEWCNVTAIGRKPVLSAKPMPPFNDLIDALDQIEAFHSGEKIHYPKSA